MMAWLNLSFSSAILLSLMTDIFALLGSLRLFCKLCNGDGVSLIAGLEYEMEQWNAQ